MKFRWPFLSRKESVTRQLMAVSTIGKPVSTPRNYASFSDEGYQKNVVAFRAISQISSNCGALHWVLYSKQRGGKRTEIIEHPLLDLLAKPNPMQSQSEFFEAVVAYKFIAGNSYIQSVGPNPKTIQELWPCRPDCMKVIPGRMGTPAAYEFSFGGQSARFEVDVISGRSPILHLKFFNPINNWYGMSPIEAAMYSIDVFNEAGRWNLALLQNSAMPSGAMVATGQLSDEQYARLKREIDEKFAGARNAGRPMLLEGGLDWKGMSLAPKDMDWVENKRTSAREVAMAFGYPPMLLGIPGDNTYSNYKEARLALYEETILPTADSLKVALNNWLTPAFGDGLELDYDKDRIDALAPKRDSVWDRVTKATHLTVNEKREATGYEEVDDGDVILVPTTNTTLEDLTAEPDPAVADPNNPDPDADGSDPNNPDPDDEDHENGEDPDAEDDAPAGQQTGGKSVRIQMLTKVFNLSSRKEKMREWKSVNRLRSKHQSRMKAQVKSLFQIEGHNVAEAIKGMDPHQAISLIPQIIEKNKPMWKSAMTSTLKRTGQEFGARVVRSIKASGKITEKKDATVVDFDTDLSNWIQDHVGDQIDGIADTSRDRVIKALRRQIDAGTDEGEGLPDISDRVEDVYAGFEGSRADTISRTEVNAASNAASLIGARSTGVPNLQKEWIAINDDRTRDDHSEVSGTQVPIDDTFTVGDSDMDGPGDPNGDPSEVINCRCTLGYVGGEEEDEE